MYNRAIVKKGIIYKATGPTGKVYIGKTVQGLKNRIKGHKNTSNNPNSKTYGCHFARAIRKYGIKEFDWEILLDNIPATYLGDVEKIIISLYNSYERGYNSTIGGEGTTGRMLSESERNAISERQRGKNNSFYGKTHTNEVKKMLSDKSKMMSGPNHPQYGKSLSDATKSKMSKALSGESNPFYGRSHSVEAKLKISRARLGTSMSEETKKKISKTMSKKHSGKNNPFYGKKHSKDTKDKISQWSKEFVRTESHKNKISESNKRTKRKNSMKSAVPFVVRENDNIVGEWLLAVECAEDLNLDYGSILKCLKNKQKIHRGYTFKFKE